MQIRLMSGLYRRHPTAECVFSVLSADELLTEEESGKAVSYSMDIKVPTLQHCHIAEENKAEMFTSVFSFNMCRLESFYL
jgi:hypothetical protein